MREAVCNVAKDIDARSPGVNITPIEDTFFHGIRHVQTVPRRAAHQDEFIARV
jgi:hypothetical protein